MLVVHLTSSRFFGGPERQMLELAQALPDRWRSAFLSFSEGGRCRTFLDKVNRAGFHGRSLTNDMPYLWSARQELEQRLRHWQADLLCCHGYKADLLGWRAARRLGIPVIAVSRGWTSESWRVRLYEALDQFVLRKMDRVVCVSQGQEQKVRQAGVPADRTTIIRNAIRLGRFTKRSAAGRDRLQEFFDEPKRRIVAAAGRLSPEKGFSVLIDAAAEVAMDDPSIGFLIFGEGPLHRTLQQQIERRGLTGHFALAGFRTDLDQVLPGLDLLVLPSYTEGLPNVVLEAFAAEVPVVATSVGGIPEVVDEDCGLLVPPGDAVMLAQAILGSLAYESERKRMGRNGRRRVKRHFTFAAQAEAYEKVFAELAGSRSSDWSWSKLRPSFLGIAGEAAGDRETRALAR